MSPFEKVVRAMERMDEIFGENAKRMERAEPMIVRHGRHHIRYQDVLGVANVFRSYE